MSKSNFFVLPEYGLLSMGIPKCGQTSMKRALLGPDVYNVHDKKHFDYLDNHGIEDTVDTLREEGLISFTFVRNPYDRILSFWKQKISVPNKFTSNRGPFREGMSFSDTVNLLCQLPDCMSNIHHRSQISIIRVRGRLPDFIGRLETYQKDWDELGQAIGRELPRLPWENKTDSCDSGRLWTHRLAQMVYERYREDFEILGYDR